MLSLYNNKDLLYSLTFYNKIILLAKYNYEIHDKKLSTIIKYLNHSRLKLKTINILIKIFINYKFLKYFMIIKKLFLC